MVKVFRHTAELMSKVYYNAETKVPIVVNASRQMSKYYQQETEALEEVDKDDKYKRSL